MQIQRNNWLKIDGLIYNYQYNNKIRCSKSRYIKRYILDEIQFNLTYYEEIKIYFSIIAPDGFLPIQRFRILPY